MNDIETTPKIEDTIGTIKWYGRMTGNYSILEQIELLEKQLNNKIIINKDDLHFIFEKITATSFPDKIMPE